jgi:hypothetical protein
LADLGKRLINPCRAVQKKTVKTAVVDPLEQDQDCSRRAGCAMPPPWAQLLIPGTSNPKNENAYGPAAYLP